MRLLDRLHRGRGLPAQANDAEQASSRAAGQGVRGASLYLFRARGLPRRPDVALLQQAHILPDLGGGMIDGDRAAGQDEARQLVGPTARDEGFQRAQALAQIAGAIHEVGDRGRGPPTMTGWSASSTSSAGMKIVREIQP